MATEKQKVAVGCDHAGFIRKQAVLDQLTILGFDVLDFGTNSDQSVDYPDFAHAVSKAVLTEEALWGIVICGSGNGVAITANKYRDIRCSLCWTPEIAALAHQHNNANVIALPGRFITDQEAKDIVSSYVNAAFEGGRHQTRIDKITSCL